MKKKTAHKKHVVRHSTPSRTSRATASDSSYVVLIRSWVFLVLFAIMLGVGVIVGSYINGQLNGYPTVAGVSTQR